jgi:hypothetical protein
MQSMRFPLAVLGTSLALVALLVVAAGWFVGNAFAAGFTHAGPWDLPGQLTGLRDIPASERFSHFKGVQVNLTDKDNRPVALTVTPGTVTSTSANSLTINGNDGASHSYTLDSNTALRGKSSLSQGDKVVVATLNNSPTAFAVMAGDPSGFHRGPAWAH